MTSSATGIAPAEGRLGVLLAGMGSVASTLIAGVALTRRGLGRPIGSLAELHRVALGTREEPRFVPLRELVPLAGLGDLVFGGWDPVEPDALEAAHNAAVLPPERVAAVEEELAAVRAFPAAFRREAVPRLEPRRVKDGRAADVVEQLREDIRSFRRASGAARVLVCCVASTEVLREEAATALGSLARLEEAIARDDPLLAPTVLYAYAALLEGCPFVNGTPNLCTDAPGLLELALARGLPVAGKDLKTGQTMIKTALAPAFAARMLGLRGWYSTNILGNRDGEVLEEPGSFRSKEATKRSVLDGILRADLYPELYGDCCHKVRIDYYPPHGDGKEGWDNIDIVGWLGLPMQLKVNFLCRDSILAAPVVLDLVLLTDLAHRAGLSGVQEWLSFYFKSPLSAAGLPPEHDLFAQQRRLHDALRELGERAAAP